MKRKIGTIEAFIKATKTLTKDWDSQTIPWYRGEPEVQKPLLPGLYREQPDGSYLNENRILQSFRRMGPAFLNYKTPNINEIDQWLFIAQHLRIPTRLLDWTEGALIGLYFALQFPKPIIWILNPDLLNHLSVPDAEISPGVFPLTWLRPKAGTINIGHENIRGAWETDKAGIDLPVAVKPTYIHPRMSAQKSCFTVHGKSKKQIPDMVSSELLKRIEISPRYRAQMWRDLERLGITHTTVFPEAEFLAKELTEAARISVPPTI